jgi:hypothetical protein
VATSATYSGPITVCILHTGLSAPSLWHASGTWNQVTPATDDGTTICGSVTSLSPFALLLNTGGQPPTADAGGPYSVDEGGSVTLTGSGTDPGGEPLSLAWDIEGDGSFETAGQAVNFSAVAIDGPATRTVQLQVTNTFGLKAEDAATVSVANAAPTVGSIALPAAPALIGATFSVSAPFMDPAPGDTHVAEWDWGDGSTSAGAVVEAGGTGTAAGSHAYRAAGSYKVIVSVTDDDGGSGSADATFIAVYKVCLLYDPNRPNRGGAIPIKLELCDVQGNDLSAPTVVVTAVSTTAPEGLVSAGNTNPGNRFRYDATLGSGGGYVYNLDVTRDPAGSYVLRFKVASDAYVYSVAFRIG